MRIMIALIISLIASIGGARAQSPTLQNLPPYTGTTLGAGYTFTGTAATLFANNIGAYNFSLPFSASLWVKYPTLLTSATVVNFLSGMNGTASGFSVSAPGAQTADSLLLQTFIQPTPGTCAGAKRMCAPVKLINDSNWHHLCAIWSGTGRGSQFWVDGIRRGFGPAGATMTANAVYPWVLGQNAPSGTIEADVAVWNRSLTQGECATIYRRGLADKSLLSGNAPTSLNNGLVAYWPLNNCTGTNPVSCADSSANANPAHTALPPTVAITAPANGATGVTGSLTLSATCTDPLGVTSVAFLIDGLTAVTDTTSPYSATFDSTLIDDVANPHTATALCTNIGAATASASATFSTANGTIAARTFYLSVAGSDTNDGSIGSPWLSPNHNLRCGDTILAQPSQSYFDGNFFTGKWGTVWSCPTAVGTTGIYFAFLKCNGSFVQDCFIQTNCPGCGAIRVSASNWAIQGWTASSTQVATSCFSTSSSNIHYVLWLNDYAKGCTAAGFGVPDYGAVVGSLSYGNGFNGSSCFQGISSTIPLLTNNPSDTGTHWFIGGTFSINNGNPQGCTDGNGTILDIMNSGRPCCYLNQIVMEQNLYIGNGSLGFEMNQGTPPVFVMNSTYYGNGLEQGAGRIGQIELIGNVAQANQVTGNVTMNNLIAVSIGGPNVCKFNRTAPYTCPAPPPAASGFAADYAIVVNNANGAGSTCPGASPCALNSSYVWDASGNSLFINDSLNVLVQSGNTFADPLLSSPALPTSAPDCSASATVFACVASIRANFVPSGGAASKGYQPPGACAADSLYPIWLKGSVPNGLLTKPCGF